MTENYNLIEDYLTGGLSEKDTIMFQQRLETEPAFLEAYEMRKSMFLMLKHKKDKVDLKKKLAVLSHQYLSDEEKIDTSPAPSLIVNLLQSVWLKYATVAAAVLLIMFLVNHSLPQENLYGRYAETVTMDITQRSTTFSLEDTQTAFNAKNYLSAYNTLHTYLAKTDEDTRLYFYLGVCALELDKTGEALAIFSIIATGDTAYASEGRWFQVLSYLKAEDLVNCKKILTQIPAGDKWFGKAQGLLREIEEQ